MAAKKSVKIPSPDDVTEEEYADMAADGARIHLADDLMKTKASLALKAREAKRKGELSDTWIIDSKVIVEYSQYIFKYIPYTPDYMPRRSG